MVFKVMNIFEAIKGPYHMTFFNVLSSRTLLESGNDLSDLILVKLDHFKKSQIFDFFSMFVC